MKDLIKEIAADFEYNGVIQDKEDSIYIKGEYYFESKFMCSDFDLIAKFEDGDMVDFGVDFGCNEKHITEGFEMLLENMLKLFISEGFISWKEEYNER